ncbi:uncharacterized protein KY384_006267 [Bacidia gigantensis]|uniref:uncharacterized protein n=1 Tax=Bacidia gigantensis TaxID=2732470 RepID=UPI001D041BC3|nr:uncharacterized protein KY384_006267 [Bacidia gigantensis]KAG8528580.1 hypothetical protein KY384_006267 [Bacidia gigantensis]
MWGHYHFLREKLSRDTTQASSILRLIDEEAQRKRYYEVQKNLIKSGVAREVLISAFRRLTRVTAIDIILTSCSIGGQELETSFGVLNNEEYKWDLKITLPILFKAMRGLSSPLRRFRFRYEDGDELYPSVDYFDNDYPSVVNDTCWEALLSFAKEFDLNQLERLELNWSNLAYCGGYDRESLRTYRSAAVSILGKAPYINSVRIQMPANVDFGANTSRIFTYLLSEIPFLHLVKLELLEIGTNVEEPLSLLLARQSSRLRTVYLDTFDETVAWALFLRSQRGIDWHVLQSFIIYSRSYRSYFDATAYVRRETNHHPLTALDEAESENDHE